jgi:hypothetical protein
MYHGFSIRVQGTAVGRIVELNPEYYGHRFCRAEVWLDELERVTDEEVYTVFVNPNRPFTVDEVLLRGHSIHRQYEYNGCWFRSQTLDPVVTGDGIVSVTGELVTSPRVRIV